MHISSQVIDKNQIEDKAQIMHHIAYNKKHLSIIYYRYSYTELFIDLFISLFIG